MNLEKFAKKIFEVSGWPEGGDIEGGDLQAIAVECGLLIPQTRHEPCCEECHCADYWGSDEMRDGVTCYRKCELLLTDAPTVERFVVRDLLADKHHGMRISAPGILRRVGGLFKPGAQKMLKHLHEMASRFYTGDVKAVDEFLQLYCLDEDRPST